MYRQLLRMVSRGNLHVTATPGPISIIDHHHEHYDLHKHCDHHDHHDHHNYNLHNLHKHNYNHHDYNPTFSSVGSGMSMLILFNGLTHMTTFIQILGMVHVAFTQMGVWFGNDFQWILQMSSFINYLTMLLRRRGAVATDGM